MIRLTPDATQKASRTLVDAVGRRLPVFQEPLFAVVRQTGFREPGFGGSGVILQPLAGDVLDGVVPLDRLGHRFDPRHRHFGELQGEQVDEGLDHTLAGFVRGQPSQPLAGGGGIVSRPA